ncbi:MAG: TRAP transporter small permease [Desulfobacterales bacterium]
MEKLSNLFKKTYQKLNFVASMGLFAIACLVVFNILLRVFLGKPVFGAYEYVTFLTVIVVSLALADCALKDGHISVTFFTDKLPKKIRLIVNILTGVFTSLTFILITWRLIIYAQTKYLTGETSGVTHIPLHYVVIIIVLGFLLLLSFILIQLIENIMKFFAGKD